MKRLLQLLLLMLCFASVEQMHAQTLEASPYAQMTLDNGLAVDTTFQVGEKYTGKAPMEVSFYANVTTSSANLHYLWEIANNAEYTSADVSYEKEFTRKFETAGTYYIRLTLTDLDLDIVNVYDPFTFTLAESKLLVPNTFTPNGDGQHDVLKVQYESLVSFKAAVFNRWGKKLYSWTNPEGGWDGGDAKAGVYFIVVQAKGSDGVKYDIKQAVNLLNASVTGVGN
ncbi:MAG: gliding motility-associated C-terminal domain-containing protein [Bacteroidaceae bacterium]